jgi:hypothetical protein
MCMALNVVTIDKMVPAIVKVFSFAIFLAFERTDKINLTITLVMIPDQPTLVYIVYSVYTVGTAARWPNFPPNYPKEAPK